jgi:hypothetical protein
VQVSTAGEGHGEQGDVPDGISFDDLETVGARQVEMDYPEERDSEQVLRMCPYCKRPFRGKEGVMIHLGQLAGRKNHPENAQECHEEDDFPIVHVDDKGNIVDMPEETASSLPAPQPTAESVADEKQPVRDSGDDSDTITLIVEHSSAQVSIRTDSDQTQVTIIVEGDNK